MPIDLLDPRHGPTVAPQEFFARRHKEDPALRTAYEEIARHRQMEIKRRGLEPDAPDDFREAAALRVASGAYRAYLRHDPKVGDAVDLGDNATLVIRRGEVAHAWRARRWHWGLLGAGYVAVYLLQAFATLLARPSPEGEADDPMNGREPRR